MSLVNMITSVYTNDLSSRARNVWYPNFASKSSLSSNEDDAFMILSKHKTSRYFFQLELTCQQSQSGTLSYVTDRIV
jgi:hypothetical protein